MAASRIGLLFTVTLVAGLAALAGCGFTLSATAYQTPVPLRGTVRGGDQPVAGASIQFYAAGTSGPGSAALLFSANLSSPTVTATSPFLLPSSASSSISQVYVVARGGKPGTLSAAATLLLSSRRCLALVTSFLP